MSCTTEHCFHQIDSRDSPRNVGIITNQCSKCGIIDNTISNETYTHTYKHSHSPTNMNFVGQVVGQYVLRCNYRNCNYQIRIKQPFQQELKN